MATPTTTIESQHSDMIHDCQFDYYSKKLATCSSDSSIKIFDVNGDIYHCSATLNVHEGPVWQVSWAHPKFGVLLASCSYDGSIVVQKELSTGNWIRIMEHKFPDASVNSIAWAPHEFGLVLACATSEGKVAVFEYKNNSWYALWVCLFQLSLLFCCYRNHRLLQNDSLGCNSVSWAPYHAVTSHSTQHNGALIYRLATGSSDNMVRIWQWIEGTQENLWIEEPRTVQTPHSGMHDPLLVSKKRS